MSSSSATESDAAVDKDLKKNDGGEKIQKVITTNIPMKGEFTEKVEDQRKIVNVTIPVKLPKNSDLSSSPTNQPEDTTITVSATEVKKITTVHKICPKRVQTLVISELEPEIQTKQLNKKEVLEIKTPIRKHLTTTTTIQRITQVTTATKTIIGEEKHLTNDIETNNSENLEAPK